MNARLKLIRKELKMNQEEFGKRIGIGKTSVSKLETGENNPSDQTLILICKEFNVNEEWLKAGVGEMFIKLPPEDETAALVYELLGNRNQFQELIVDIMKTYDKLSLDSQAVVNDFIGQLRETIASKKEE